MWVDDLAGEPDPAGALLDGSNLTRAQIDAALRYRGMHPDEIEARVELHREETAAAARARIVLDEMYAPALAETLRTIDVARIAAERLTAGRHHHAPQVGSASAPRHRVCGDGPPTSSR